MGGVTVGVSLFQLVGAIALVALSSLALALVVRSRRRQRRSPVEARRLHVMAWVAGPARDLAETLPYSNVESAAWDRRFGYAQHRRPSYRPDLDSETADRLKPAQIVRVRDAGERQALARQQPAHLKVLFVEDDSPSSGVTTALPLSKPRGD